LDYMVNEDGVTCTITNCRAVESKLVIPETLDGFAVTAIADFAFANCDILTTVEIPACVTHIGKAVFYDCSELTLYVYNHSQALQYAKENNIPYVIKDLTEIKGEYMYRGGTRLDAYQLVEFEGNLYFINDYHKLAKNTRLYLGEQFVGGFTYADGTPLAVGSYEFDADGKMIVKNGPVGDYFYKNNTFLKAYQLVEFEGDYYFVNDYHKLAKNTRLYLTEQFVGGFTYADGTPLAVGYYEFDADGKMIVKNGPVGDYFYKNNTFLKAYQLVEFEGDYYFINDYHKLAKNKRLYLGASFVNGTPFAPGYYEFDENGKMIRN